MIITATRPVLVETGLLLKTLKRLPPVRWGRDAVALAGGEHLTLRRAGDGVEAEVRLPFPAEGFPGAVVPRKPLLELLEGAGGMVELTLEEGWLKVRGRGFSAQIFTYDPEARPVGVSLLTGEANPLFRVQALAFLEAFGEAATLARASSHEKARKVLLEVEAGRVRLVATDGYRLYTFSLEAETPTPGVELLLKPEEALAALKALDPGLSFTFLQPEAHALVAETLWGRAAFPLAEEGFVPYRKVLPQGEPLGRLRVEARALREALGRALVVAEPKNHGVELQALGEEVRVQALGEDFTPLSEEVLPGEGEGRLRVNGKYLLGALEVFGPGKAELRLYPHAQGGLVALGREGFHALIALLKPAQDAGGEG
ncbi:MULTISPECIES: hypothetical protein [unclassified Thermus]|uniref:hypothetical protein n=1 Tax=unclassified Thermus TaxID=2619321 RepID=UPI0025EE9095|nr:hypothetical protein [Thermus sp.]MCS6869596.1 hypothetical protein [Thermus sp.]MCX7850179.1 hypothetical protein [Thermus sp.]MDW8017191.1 hypothetical protein [Thermus sp.]MDW8357641.1 hypothetical protein [Thermus sp.]